MSDTVSPKRALLSLNMQAGCSTIPIVRMAANACWSTSTG